KSDEGRARVSEVSAAVRVLTEESVRVKTLVDEVSASSEEQTRGLRQGASALGQMERLTQQSAAIAEETASASEELTAQSETMREIAGRMAALCGASIANGAPKVSAKPPRAGSPPVTPRRPFMPASTPVPIDEFEEIV